MSRVTLGGVEQAIPPFKANKARHALKLLSQIGKVWPEILGDMAKFRKEFEQANSTVVTRDEAENNAAVYKQELEQQLVIADAAVEQASTDEEKANARRNKETLSKLAAVPSAWENLLNGRLKEQPQIELPQPPSEQVVWASVLPKAMEKAEQEITQLLALILIPSRELHDAKQSETGDEAIERLLQSKGDELMVEADISELIDLAEAGAEVLQGQVKGKGGAVGNFLSGLLGIQLSPETPQTEPTPPVTPTSAPTEQKTKTEMEGSTSEPSQRSSPESADGPSEKPSSMVPS